MTIQKICKKIFLFALFLTLVLQLGSTTSWFLAPSDDLIPTTKNQTHRDALPLCITHEQLTASLAQFTTDGVITRNDTEQFIASAERGARIAYQLFFVEKPAPLQFTPLQFTHRKEHLHALVDLISFFYLVAMLSRDDGLMPDDVTFGVIDPDGRFDAFVHQYLARVERKKLHLGSTSSIFGANRLAYFRTQSHGFNHAWGINLCFKKDQPRFPLLFTGRWEDERRLPNVSGPLYHLLIGADQHELGKLYIKPEECGIYYWGEWFGHVKGYLKALGRRTVLINHLLDDDDDPQCNKEHLPRAVLYAFKACVRAHIKRLGPSERAAIRRGIAGMYAHAIRNGWDDFVGYIDSRFSMPHTRRGNEIIVARETAIWSAYFVAADSKKIFEALAAVKRAFTCCALTQMRACSLKNVRESIQKFCAAHAALQPEGVVGNSWLGDYLGRLAVRFEKLCAMSDASLADVIERRHRQLFM